LLLLRLQRKNAAARMRKRPATDPIAIPAMAPLDNDDFDVDEALAPPAAAEDGVEEPVAFVVEEVEVDVDVAVKPVL